MLSKGFMVFLGIVGGFFILTVILIGILGKYNPKLLASVVNNKGAQAIFKFFLFCGLVIFAIFMLATFLQQ